MKTDRNRTRAGSPLCAAAILLFLPAATFCQSRISGTADQDRTSDRSRSVQELAAQPSPVKAVALESTIDPLNYYVGPSDVIGVNIWLAVPVNFVLTVTPEGTLIVPTVGEIHVADTTLAVAKTAVLSEVRKRYKYGDATVTLLSPRSIVVTVAGNVLNPGSYVLTSTSRVDKAIEEANKLRQGQDPKALELLQKTMSTRNIAIRHKDGRTTRADITKFFATKVDLWNPYLREGDIIIVPRNDFARDVIGIYGEVNAPGRYEFVQGDSIRDALQIAYGFTRLAIADSIELSRLDLSGRVMTTLAVDGAAVMARRAPDLALVPGDRIVVRATPDLRGDYRVKVSGEVLHPGTYPITRNTTRLTDIIARAGGFTGYASLSSSMVLRQSVLPTDVPLERLQNLRGGVPVEDTTYFYVENELRIQKEIVNVDFTKLFTGKDTTGDIILQDDDQVVVASVKRTVYVFGQVASPGDVAFIPGQDLAYYIIKAGGYTERARTEDTKIVKAKTRQWLGPKETTIEEGDQIWVPKELERSFSYYMGIIGQTAAIISVAVSVILLAR